MRGFFVHRHRLKKADRLSTVGLWDRYRKTGFSHTLTAANEHLRVDVLSRNRTVLKDDVAHVFNEE